MAKLLKSSSITFSQFHFQKSAREGPGRVSPVVLTLDESLTHDRTLYLVRAMRFFVDQTMTIRQGEELLFVSPRRDSLRNIFTKFYLKVVAWDNSEYMPSKSTSLPSDTVCHCI